MIIIMMTILITADLCPKGGGGEVNTEKHEKEKGYEEQRRER